MASVWIVSIEWNFPPSEVTGDTGIVDVFTSEDHARACQAQTRKVFETQGDRVHDYTYAEGRYCGDCGEDTRKVGGKHICTATVDSAGDDGSFCDQCGAELTDNGTCDNDHDEWSVDIHCLEYQVKTTAPDPALADAI